MTDPAIREAVVMLLRDLGDFRRALGANAADIDDMIVRVELAAGGAVGPIQVPSGRSYRLNDGVLECEFDTGWSPVDQVDLPDVVTVAALLQGGAAGEGTS